MQDLRGIVVTEGLIQAFQENQLTWDSLQKTILIHMDQQHGIQTKFSENPVTHGGTPISMPMLIRDARRSFAAKDRIPHEHPILLIDNLLLRCLNTAWHIEHTLHNKGLTGPSQNPRSIFINLMAHVMSIPVEVYSEAAIKDLEERFNRGCVDVLLENQLCTKEDSEKTLLQHRFLASTLAPAFGQMTLLDLTNYVILEEICYPMTVKTYDQLNLLASDKCDQFSLGVQQANIAAASNIKLQDRRLPAHCNSTHLQTVKNAWIVENIIYFPNKLVEKFSYMTAASLVPLVDKSHLREIDDVVRENIKQLIDHAKKFGIPSKLHLLILDSQHRNQRDNHRLENTIVEFTRKGADSMRAPCSYYPLYDTVTNTASFTDPTLDKRLAHSRGDRATHAANLCKSASINGLTPVILSQRGQTRSLVVGEMYAQIKTMEIYQSRSLTITRQELEHCRAKGLSIPMLATLAAPGSFGLKSEAKSTNLFSASTNALLFCDNTAKTNSVIMIGKKSFDTNKVSLKSSVTPVGFSKSTPSSPRSPRATSIVLGTRRGSVLRTNKDSKDTPIDSLEEAAARPEVPVVQIAPVSKQRSGFSASAPTSPRAKRALSVSPGSHRKYSPAASPTTSPRGETVIVEEVFFEKDLPDAKKPAPTPTVDNDNSDDEIVIVSSSRHKTVNQKSLGFSAPPSSPALNKTRAATTASVRKLPAIPVATASVSPPLSPAKGNRARTTTFGKDLRSVKSPALSPLSSPRKPEPLQEKDFSELNSTELYQSSTTIDLTEVLRSVDGIIAERDSTESVQTTATATVPVKPVLETIVITPEIESIDVVTEAPAATLTSVPSISSALPVSLRSPRDEQLKDPQVVELTDVNDEFSTEMEISPALAVELESEKDAQVVDSTQPRTDITAESLIPPAVILTPTVQDTSSAAITQSAPAIVSPPASPARLRAKRPSTPPPMSPNTAKARSDVKSDKVDAKETEISSVKPAVRAASAPASPSTSTPSSPSRVRGTSSKYPASPPRSPSTLKKTSTATTQQPQMTTTTVSPDPINPISESAAVSATVLSTEPPVMPVVPALDIRRLPASSFSSVTSLSPRSARSGQSPKAGEHRTNPPITEKILAHAEIETIVTSVVAAPVQVQAFSTTNPVSPRSPRSPRGSHSPQLGLHRRDLNEFDPSILTNEFTADLVLPPPVLAERVTAERVTLNENVVVQSVPANDSELLAPAEVVVLPQESVRLTDDAAPSSVANITSPRIGTHRNPSEIESNDRGVSHTIATDDFDALMDDLQELPAPVVVEDAASVTGEIPKPQSPRSSTRLFVEPPKKQNPQVPALQMPPKKDEKQEPTIPETFTSVKVRINDFMRKNPESIFTPSLTLIVRDIKETDANALVVLKDLDLVVNDPENSPFAIKKLIINAEAMHKQHNRNKRIMAIILLILGIAMIATGIALGAFPIAQLTLQETFWTSFNFYANLEAMKIASAVVGGLGLIVTAISGTLFYRSRLQGVPQALKQVSSLAETESNRLSDAKGKLLLDVKGNDDFGDVFEEPNKGFF